MKTPMKNKIQKITVDNTKRIHQFRKQHTTEKKKTTRWKNAKHFGKKTTTRWDKEQHVWKRKHDRSKDNTSEKENNTLSKMHNT